MSETKLHAGQAILDGITVELGRIASVADLSDQRYHETHDEFESVSDQRALILDWLERWADAARWPAGRAEVLSVGCGGGTMDMRIADVFTRHTASLSKVGVDPNPLHTQAFIDAFADGETDVEAITESFETYTTTRRFDVIHFVHCLYYFEQLEPALRHAMELLKPGGTMIVLNAPNEALNALADRIWRKQWSRSAWFSDDVRAALEAINVDARIERINAWVDVTACLDPDDAHGERVLDFIVQAETARFTPHLRALLRAYLDAIGRDVNGRRLAPHPVDAFTVHAA